MEGDVGVEGERETIGPVRQPSGRWDRPALERAARDLRNPWTRRYVDVQVALLRDEGRDPEAIAEQLHLPQEAVAAALERVDGEALDPPGRAAMARAGRRVVGWGRVAMASAGRPWARSAAIVATFAALVAVWPTHELISGGRYDGQNDVPIHITLAGQLRLVPFHTPVPHFLFHVAAQLVDSVLGLVGAPFGASIAVVMIGARAAIGAAAFAVISGVAGSTGPRPSRGAAVVAACVAVVIESPRVLVDGAMITEGHAYLPVQYYFNPTATLATSFALLTPPALERLITNRAGGGRDVAIGVWTLAVVVLGVLAKPSLAQVLLPVLPFWAWWLTRRGAGRVRPVATALAGWVVAPAVAVMLWQLWFIANGLPPELRGGFIWSPLLVARAWGIGHWTAMIGLAVPAAAALVTRGRWFGQPAVALLSAAFVVGVVQFMLLAEGGDQTIHGNVGHAAQIVFVLLVVEALRTLAVELAPAAWRGGTVGDAIRRSTATVIVGAGLASGIVGYVTSLR